MFGLMKARSCALPDELRRHRRLHYCGTCKTMGSLYGQPSRALLNHDTAFLAELLTAISRNGEDRKDWDRAYQSFNCLAAPKEKARMPLPLQVAATATMFLTEFKIADHINDSRRPMWRAAHKAFSRPFERASQQLRDWQFPVEELRDTLRSQERRETTARSSSQPPEAMLRDLAAPTAMATALFCQHGARLVGEGEAEQTLYALGYNFGAVAYLTDAFEDYERDGRKGEFNAIRAAYRLAEPTLPGEARRKVQEEVRVLEAEIKTALSRLPLTPAMKEMFAERLRSNLSRRLGGLPVLKQAPALATPSSCPTTRQDCRNRLDFAARWRRAIGFGHAAVERYRAERQASRAASLVSPLVFAAVFPAAFFAPHQVTEGASYRECLGLGLNLMFLGAVLRVMGAVFAKPLRFAASMASGGQVPGPDMASALNEDAKKRRQSGGGCDCCHCDCCDACECCHCDCCHCDGCDCCGCDCG